MPRLSIWLAVCLALAGVGVGCPRTEVRPNRPEATSNDPSESAVVAVVGTAPPVEATIAQDAGPAGPTSEHCAVADLSEATGTACVCAGRAGCRLEKWIDAGKLGVVASIAIADTTSAARDDAGACRTTASMESELWLLRRGQTTPSEWLLRLLTRNGAVSLPNCVPPLSFDQLLLKDGVLVYAGSHPWREAHDSNLTGHGRLRIRLDSLQFEREQWSWRRCCFEENGELNAVGFATSCMQHWVVTPSKLEGRYDHDRGRDDGKTCAPGKGRTIPELYVPDMANGWRETALGDCALWLNLDKTRVGALATDTDLFIELRRPTGTGGAWGTLEIASGVYPFELPKDEAGDVLVLGGTGTIVRSTHATVPKVQTVDVTKDVRRYRITPTDSFDSIVLTYSAAGMSVSSGTFLRDKKDRPLATTLTPTESFNPNVSCTAVDGALVREVATPPWNEPLEP